MRPPVTMANTRQKWNVQRTMQEFLCFFFMFNNAMIHCAMQIARIQQDHRPVAHTFGTRGPAHRRFVGMSKCVAYSFLVIISVTLLPQTEMDACGANHLGLSPDGQTRTTLGNIWMKWVKMHFKVHSSVRNNAELRRDYERICHTATHNAVSFGADDHSTYDGWHLIPQVRT